MADFDFFDLPSERQIFRYHNGTATIAADPLALQDGLVSFKDFDLDSNLRLLKLAAPEAADEQRKAAVEVVEVIRKVFNVPEYAETDGKPSGLTRSECLSLLGNFLRYLAHLKKSTAPLPTSPPSTASEGQAATPSSADYSSTATEPSSATASASL